MLVLHLEPTLTTVFCRKASKTSRHASESVCRLVVVLFRRFLAPLARRYKYLAGHSFVLGLTMTFPITNATFTRPWIYFWTMRRQHWRLPPLDSKAFLAESDVLSQTVLLPGPCPWDQRTSSEILALSMLSYVSKQSSVVVQSLYTDQIWLNILFLIWFEKARIFKK